ncbi:hypothetical protein FRC08_004714, partial [Ceratobasidium sp. 394]
MIDFLKHDISAVMSLLQLSDSHPASTAPEIAVAPNSAERATTVHYRVKKEDEEVALSDEVDKKDNILAVVQRPKYASTKGKHGLRIDCCAKLLSKTPIGTPLESPAAKGDYIIGPSMADLLLGKCKYFVAPVEVQAGKMEYPIFSISIDKHLVSLIDCDSRHLDNELVVKLDESNPALCFAIGSRTYFWNSVEHKLECLFTVPGDANHLVQQVSMPLYDNLNDARGESQRWYQLILPGSDTTVPEMNQAMLLSQAACTSNEL